MAEKSLMKGNEALAEAAIRAYTTIVDGAGKKEEIAARVWQMLQ